MNKANSALQKRLRKVKENPSAIVAELRKKYNIRTIGGRNDTVYIFKDGIFQPCGGFLLKKEIAASLDDETSSYKIKEILEKIKIKTYEETIPEVPKNLICLENGVLNLDTYELKPHDHEYPFLARIPVKFNPEAQCPNVASFLKTVFYEDDIDLIQEFCGFCLQRDYQFKKALILLGAAHTGKTTFIEFLKRFLGGENCTSVSLQNIVNNRFASANLFGKMANTFDDLDFKDISSAGGFKMATGNGTISAEIKFGNTFNFVSYAKMVFAANKIPAIKIDDDAYYSRWLIVQCGHIFPNSERDGDILDRIATPEELSGFLNVALAARERLILNKRFTGELSELEVKAIMQSSASSLARFVQQKIKVEIGSSIPKQEFYNLYVDFCKKENLSPINIQKVGRELLNYISAQDIYPKIDNKQVHCWGDIQIQDR